MFNIPKSWMLRAQSERMLQDSVVRTSSALPWGLWNTCASHVLKSVLFCDVV